MSSQTEKLEALLTLAEESAKAAEAALAVAYCERIIAPSLAPLAVAAAAAVEEVADLLEASRGSH